MAVAGPSPAICGMSGGNALRAAQRSGTSASLLPSASLRRAQDRLRVNAFLLRRRCGRRRTGVHPMRGVHMPPELEAKIASWIERQPEPTALLSEVEGPSRSEAIRRLVERGLNADSDP